MSKSSGHSTFHANRALHFEAMFGQRFHIMNLLGFPIYIDLSWFIAAILIAWSLAVGLFPARLPQQEAWVYWTMGAGGALGLFGSILLHELGHAVVARRLGVGIRGITLFIFGGVAEMTDEPPSARAEFLVAIGGPIVSVILAIVFGGAWYVVGGQNALPGTTVVLGWLGWINGILVTFNMVPAFPLDGGRVLRALLWYWKGNIRWATYITSTVGSAFGLGLIGLGALSLIFGNFIGAIWLGFLGLFLRNAAKMSYRQLVIRRELEGETVRKFMRQNITTVPENATITSFVNDYIYQYHQELYPVGSNGEFKGCITVDDVRNTPRETWDQATVGEHMRSCDDSIVIDADADAMDAIAKMNRVQSPYLLVTEHGDFVGIISMNELLQLIAMKTDLEGGGP